jgi:hypothetical protein
VPTDGAGSKHIVVAAGYSEISIVYFIEDTKGGTGLNLKRGNPCDRVEFRVEARHHTTMPDSLFRLWLARSGNVASAVLLRMARVVLFRSRDRNCRTSIKSSQNATALLEMQRLRVCDDV